MATWKKVLTSADIATSVADNELGLVTGNAVYDYIQAQGFGTGGGDIEEVTAGGGIAGGGVSGAVTVSADVDDVTIELSTTGNDGKIRAKTATITSGGTALATAGQIYTFVTGLGYTTNTGTVTSVATGSGLTGGTITGSGTLSVDNTVVRTSGNQNIGGDKTFSGTIAITGNLTVSGTTTVINSTNLEVADKIIIIADGQGTPTGNVAGLQVDTSSTINERPEFLWDQTKQLTGWTLSNHNATSSTDFPVSVMQFGTGVPSTPAIETEAGVGAFFADSSNGNLYIYI